MGVERNRLACALCLNLSLLEGEYLRDLLDEPRVLGSTLACLHESIAQMRPTEIEPGSSTQVEVRYCRPADSLCCGRGILAPEFHNFVTRLRARLPLISHAEPMFAQESWRGFRL